MLFTTIEEVKQYIPVNVASKLATLTPGIEDAEEKYILPLLGAAQYNELLAYYEWSKEQQGAYSADSGDAGEGALSSLLTKVQRSLINTTYFREFDVLNVSLGDAGFQRIETEHKKSLYKYQEQSLKDSFKERGFNGLDEVVKYLDENISLFPKFQNSANYTALKGDLIKTAVEFDKYYPIKESRLVFLRLKPYMIKVEDFILKGAVGETLYSKIKNDEANNTIKELCKKALAPLSVAKALEDLRLNILDNGIFLAELGLTGGYYAHRPSTGSDIQPIMKTAQQDGDSYLKAIHDYLSENTDLEWNSYDSENKVTNIIRSNENKKTVWTGLR